MAQPTANWNHGLQVAAQSDVGMRRANNQDSHAVVMAGDQAVWQQRGHVLLVADGMGAHAAGELASKLAADNIPHTYRKLLDVAPAAAVAKAVSDANSLIHGRGSGSIDFQGMGTTCSMLVLLPYGAVIGHVGDSRIYRLRNNKLEQLTFDHSLVWEMMAAGQINEEKTPGFNVPKNVITRSLGPNAKVQVDLEGIFPLAVGDTFLLCSDGLTGPVHDEELGAILNCVPPEAAVQTLIDLANLRGGPDNITAIVVRVAGQQAVPEMVAAGDAPRKRAVHPALWITMAVCFAAAAGLWAVSAGLLPIVLSVAAGLVALGVAVMLKLDSTGAPTSRVALGPLGKAPYRSYDCQPNAELAGRLARTVTQLGAAAQKEGWQIDWDQFHGIRTRAEEATAQGEHAKAITHYAHAIRFMLSQLRSLRARGG